jgi:hypothetical protein
VISLTVRKRGMTPKVAKRLLNDIHREGMRQQGVYWRDNFRAKHFTQAGASEYDYTPRQGDRGRPGPHGFNRSYQGGKLRTKGHTRPLVFSGESEQLTRSPTIEATAKRGTARVSVRMRAYKLNFRYRGSPIDMRQEMETVSDPETRQMAGVLSTYLDRKYRDVSAQSTTKIEG